MWTLQGFIFQAKPRLFHSKWHVFWLQGYHSSCRMITTTILTTTYWVRTTMCTYWSSLYKLTSSILRTILWTRYYYYPSFTDKESEAQCLSNFPKATQLEDDRTRIGTQAVWLAPLPLLGHAMTIKLIRRNIINLPPASPSLSCFWLDIRLSISFHSLSWYCSFPAKR